MTIACTSATLSLSYYLIFTGLLSVVALMAIRWRSHGATEAPARTGAVATP